MAVFNPSKLTPLQTIAIVAIFVSLFSAGLWHHSRVFDYPGARHIALDSAGSLNVHVAERLYRYDADGRLQDTLDLTQLGVETLIGDLTFNSDNQLLLAKRNRSPSIVEYLADVIGHTPLDVKARGDAAGLYLCDLNISAHNACSRFGIDLDELSEGFFSVHDPVSDTYFISSAREHTLYRVDNTGRLIARKDKGFEYPNQLRLLDGTLWLVDTNNLSVKSIDTAIDTFGEALSSHPVANSDAEARKYSYPYSLARAGKYWWVTILDDAMSAGGLYLFDNNWDYVKSVNLPDNTRPAQLQAFGDHMLLTDSRASSVYAIDLDGQTLGSFDSDALNDLLHGQKAQRAHHDRLALSIAATAALALIAGLLIGLLGKSDNDETGVNTELLVLTPGTTSTSASISAIGTDDQRVAGTQWIESIKALEFNKNNAGSIAAAMLTLVLMVVYTLWRLEQLDDLSLVDVLSSQTLHLMLLGPVILLIGLAIVYPEHSRIVIGVYDDKLILKNKRTGKAYSGSGKSVVYDGNRICVGKFSVVLRDRIRNHYPLDQLTNSVYPLLSSALLMQPREMRTYLLTNRDESVSRAVKYMIIILVLFTAWALSRVMAG